MHADIASVARCETHHGCITCGDEAVPMVIVRVDDARGLALCEDGAGHRSSVEIALVSPVTAGEELLVHAGTAIGRAAGGGDGSRRGRAARGSASADAVGRGDEPRRGEATSGDERSEAAKAG